MDIILIVLVLLLLFGGGWEFQYDAREQVALAWAIERLNEKSRVSQP